MTHVCFGSPACWDCYCEGPEYAEWLEYRKYHDFEEDGATARFFGMPGYPPEDLDEKQAAAWLRGYNEEDETP